VLRASGDAFLALRLVGGLYLLYLGVQALRGGVADESVSPAGGSAFRQGLLTNLGNPKMAVLFTTLIPQFVSPQASWVVPLLIGAAFNVLGLLWLLGFALVASRAAGTLARPRIRRAIGRVTGVVFVGLGVRLITERA
jgi:threonine/homoserine/homoserine lactone efflux protein